MPKTITSPVKRFAGTVILADPLTFPQLIGYQETLVKMGQASGNIERLSLAARAVCFCVEAWHIPGFEAITPDTFPASPIRAVDKLLAWLIREISAEVNEAEDPNA